MSQILKHELDEPTRRFFTTRLTLVQQTVQQLNGAVALYCETHALEGQWSLAEDGSHLRQVTEEPSAGG